MIGVNLRRLRDKRGLTQGKLAALTKGAVKQSDISRTENGKTQSPGPAKLRSLAIALGVDILEFWEGAEGVVGADSPGLADLLASPLGANLSADELDALRRVVLPWGDLDARGWFHILEAYRSSTKHRGGRGT